MPLFCGRCSHQSVRERNRTGGVAKLAVDCLEFVGATVGGQKHFEFRSFDVFAEAFDITRILFVTFGQAVAKLFKSCPTDLDERS